MYVYIDIHVWDEHIVIPQVRICAISTSPIWYLSTFIALPLWAFPVAWFFSFGHGFRPPKSFNGDPYGFAHSHAQVRNVCGSCTLAMNLESLRSTKNLGTGIILCLYIHIYTYLIYITTILLYIAVYSCYTGYMLYSIDHPRRVFVWLLESLMVNWVNGILQDWNHRKTKHIHQFVLKAHDFRRIRVRNI